MSRLLRAPVCVYRPRMPLESDFHRLVREHFDTFRSVYSQRYSLRYGYWRPVIDQAISRFLKCGDVHHGFARVRCPDCQHEYLVAFSCKQRCICPSCSQKRTLLFGMHVAQDVCREVPHRQFVWTIPKRLRMFFRFHRDLLHQLPALAWRTVLEAYRAVLGPEALPGGIVAVQTFGSLIHFHPHLHGLITDGAFLPDGRFVPLPVNLTHEPFLRLWEEKVFGLLLEKGLIDSALVGKLQSWRHSGFHVDRSVRVSAGDKAGLERLAQYMARSPFSLSRLVRITGEGLVVYKAEKDSCRQYPRPNGDDLFAGPSRNYQVFEPLDLLAELTQHIPNKGQHPIRYYGIYSNKARANVASASPPMDPGNDNLPIGKTPATPAPKPSPEDLKSRRRWAMLIQKVYHVNPLLCPKCGGTMKIITFIEAHQGQVLREILERNGLWNPPPPRPPPRPPPDASNLAPRRHSQRRRPPPPASAQRYGDVAALDPDFIEHLRREAQAEQIQLPWD